MSKPKPNQRRLIRWLTIATLLIVVAGFALYNTPGWRHFRAYNKLRLGMSKSQVRVLFDRDPEYECKLRASDIWYIRAPDFLAGDFSDVYAPSGSTFTSTTELPNVYDHVQLAFDSADQLHAFTWIGETYTVESTVGSTPGSHFNVLADSYFEKQSPVNKGLHEEH
ncbi:hypothetical protein [Rubinisphaera sp.]|uniref:hypothetical protein n=1 Tax=Rubinisphaera sp. TaxID=2024857 RepID=UPI0025F59883|nr:hypothetical protein [Rubinisphaera sp.]|tara:strand:+ start:1690 stop:2187 length:498 start_codon:yes stop_codon:yes gene_type:complete